MKTVIKLLIVVAALNAAVRAGAASARYYQLRDAAQEAVTFGGQADPGALQSLILTRAAELNVPVVPENVVVAREGMKTRVQAAYVEDVELFPSNSYPMKFSFSVEAISMSLGPAPGRAR